MARTIFFFPIGIILLLLTLLSCGRQDQKIMQEENLLIKNTEVITTTFSVKQANEEYTADTIMMRQSILFDKEGKEQANIYYNPDGSIGWKDVYQYDDNGFKKGSRYFENGIQLVSYYQYDIDSIGRRLAYRALDITTDTLLYDGASRYEKGGQLKKDGYIDKKGQFRWNYEYQFDKEGNELGYVYIDLRSGDRYPTTYKYTQYNEQGKWIKRSLIENGITQSIEVREFKRLDIQ